MQCAKCQRSFNRLTQRVLCAVLIPLCGLLTGCSHPSFDDTTVVCSLPALNQKSPDAVDAALGKPIHVGSAAEDHISQHPMDMRMYEMPFKHSGCTVWFEQSRAVDFDVNFDEGSCPRSAAAALKRIGMDGAVPPTQVAPMASHWRKMTLSGMYVNDLEVQTTDNANYSQVNVHTRP